MFNGSTLQWIDMLGGNNMNQECCPSCNNDMEPAEPFCRNCGWRRPRRVANETIKRRSKLPIVLISVCATLAVMLIGCHLLLSSITSPERSMESMREALLSGDVALFLNVVGTNENDEQAIALF